MIYVDTNVFMYAVGRSHPLLRDARDFFRTALQESTRLCTSAEVLQELLHAYGSVRRFDALTNALRIVSQQQIEVWPLDHKDVLLAVELLGQHPALSARDLCHLASCRRRGVTRIKTFDQALAGILDSTC